MKAIILAAGFGRRMRPLTDSQHKTLLEIGGQTIIGRILDGLAQNGITDVIVATGYLADRLKAHLQSHYVDIEFTFVENVNYATTNNIHSLSMVLNEVEIDQDVILIESDLIFEPSVIKRLLDAPHENVALVDQYHHGMDGTVVTVAHGIITSIIPPHLQDSAFDFSDKYKTLNVYKFSRDFCNDSLKRLLNYYTTFFDQNAYYELVLGMLIYIQKATIHAEIIRTEKWAEVDDPNDLEVADFIFNSPAERYAALEKSSGGYWNYDVLDFSYIRNAHFPTPSIISEMKAGFESLLANYGSRQNLLNQKLAHFLLCRAENVCLLNGCSQTYPLLRTFFMGRKVLIPSPTFGEYERIFPGATLYYDKVGFSLEDIEAKIVGAEVIVLVNPNNPTGSCLPSTWIMELATRYQDKTFVVDESFIDFASVGSLLPLLEQERLENVIIIKSLSKSLGVPGLRLGFVYACNAAFHKFFRENVPIWNCNSLAENFLEIILKHRESVADSYTKTKQDREEFAAQLRLLPFVGEVYESAANFLLVRLKAERSHLETLPHRLLADANIYIKNVSHKFDDGNFYLRLAVRLPEENLELVNALERAFSL
ncbi:threonine-phosphate decarboxylase [Abditibacteriota bacterium]|nr:threonine-phosphate decarboxylase [Abditibacteriota bacterium]